MDVYRIQVIAVLVTGGLFVIVFELVRRRRLIERYALLWLFSSAVLLGARRSGAGLSSAVATAAGIIDAPSALFVVGFAFVLVLLLHFSLVISRLASRARCSRSASACSSTRSTSSRARAGRGGRASAPRPRSSGRPS